MKNDLEKKNTKIKELDKQNSDLRDRYESISNENKKLSASLNNTGQLSHKEKDKKIKKLEDDIMMNKDVIKQLRDENEELKKEKENIMADLKAKSNDIVNFENINKNLQSKILNNIN